MNIREVCWLLRPSRKKRIHNVAVKDIQQALINTFTNWGTPGSIKVDNCLPFVNPPTDVPAPLSLWLIGLGIDIIRIRPYHPTDNAKVERAQGLTYRWAEPNTKKDIGHLNEALEGAVKIQREIYRPKELKGKTRMEAYPALAKKGKPFSRDEFDLDKVLSFLAKGTWIRKTNYKGLFSFFKQLWYLGKVHGKSHVAIHLDKDENQWVVQDEHGNEIKRFPNDFITKDRIMNFPLTDKGKSELEK